MIRCHCERRPNRAGLTLIEVQLTVGAVFLLAVVLAIVLQLTGRISNTTSEWAYYYIKTFEQALELYAEDHDKTYPQESEGLQVLLIPREGDPHWQGPYLKNANVVPTDPWGNPFRYRFPGTKSKGKPDVWSLGEDGRDGTDDDIGNWMPPPT